MGFLSQRASKRKLMLWLGAEYRSGKAPRQGDERLFDVVDRCADGSGTEEERRAAEAVAVRAADDATEAEDYGRATTAAGLRDCLAGRIGPCIRRVVAGND